MQLGSITYSWQWHHVVDAFIYAHQSCLAQARGGHFPYVFNICSQHLQYCMITDSVPGCSSHGYMQLKQNAASA
jgi:hypothetical protein